MSDKMIERLRSQRGNCYDAWQMDCKAADEIERLREENARLREALRDLSGNDEWNCCPTSRYMKALAQNALDYEPPKPS